MDLQSLKIDRGPKSAARPGRRRGVPLWPFVLVGAGLLLWLFWPVLQPMVDRLRLPAVRTVLVTGSAPAAAAAVSGAAANGYVVAARRAALSSDVPGRIVELRVREGSVVKQGEIVARLYSDEMRAAAERAAADLKVAEASAARAATAGQSAAAAEREARAAVETAQARLQEAQAQERWAAQELQRTDDLVRQGVRSPQDQQRVQSELDAAAARTAAADAGLRSATAAAATAALQVQVARDEHSVALAQQQATAAALRLAQASLDKMDVRAPFDGIVVLKDAEVGEVVSPNSQGGSTARGAVCTMVDFASLEVQANVPETSLDSVRLGAPAEVYLDAFPARRIAGRVDRIWPTADRQKATVEVRIALDERPAELRPEMGCRIVFPPPGDADRPAMPAADARPAILVGEDAFVQIGGQDGAFVLERDAVRFQPVRLGERRSGRVLVQEGLQPGMRVVLAPPPSLRDGDRVLRQDQP